MINEFTYKKYEGIINRRETIKRGQELCESAMQVIQIRHSRLAVDPITTSSIIKMVEGSNLTSGLENKVMTFISWEDDPVGEFEKQVEYLQSAYPKLGDYLHWRYIKGFSNEEYCQRLNVTEKTMKRTRADAHYLIAIMYNLTEFNTPKHKKKIEINAKMNSH